MRTKNDSKWSMFIEKLVPFTRQTKFVPVISLQNVRSFLTHFENLIFCFSFITSPDKHIWRSLQNASVDSLSFCRLWNQHEVFLRNDGGGFSDAPICNKLGNQKFRQQNGKKGLITIESYPVLNRRSNYFLGHIQFRILLRLLIQFHFHLFRITVLCQ